MSLHADYLPPGADGQRDAMDFNPELSRRARAIPVYAAIQALGRTGIAEMVERCCAMARRFADDIATYDNVEILNEVVLNQVLVRFLADDGDHDLWTRSVVRRLQQDGTCWMGTTIWRGRVAMRISVTNWATDDDDVDQSVGAIARCLAAELTESGANRPPH
jgi:glutamate/tyrosine decarboxylase-like PLP-dependent enzyme